MTKYEFRAIPCPDRAVRMRDLPPGADAFGETLSLAINDLAVEGWDYIRSETIEVRRRRLFGSRRDQRTFLVFRREIRPLVQPLQIDAMREVRKVRARRVKSEDAVEFVRAGGRRITPNPANADAPAEAPLTAAE